jgi:hypothetical protein
MQGAMHFIESGKRKLPWCSSGLTQTTAYWEEGVKLLGDCGVHALAVDLPGFGKSNQAPGPYTIAGVADAVVKFIEARRLVRTPGALYHIILTVFLLPPSSNSSATQPFAPETVDKPTALLQNFTQWSMKFLPLNNHHVATPSAFMPRLGK